jgi:hypothetical protein
MSTTSSAAITEMVRAKFGVKDFDQMIGQPTSTSIQLLITQLAEVACSFSTRQWKANHGCLTLVLDETEMRFTSGITSLDCGPIAQPATINPAILDETKGWELLKLQEKQKTLWQEYDLQEAVNNCGVATIMQVIDAQYIEEKRKEYVGYNDEFIHSLLSTMSELGPSSQTRKKSRQKPISKRHGVTPPTNTSLPTPANWTKASGTASD